MRNVAVVSFADDARLDLPFHGLEAASSLVPSLASSLVPSGQTNLAAGAPGVPSYWQLPLIPTSWMR